jgi:hypothetical protein
MERDTLRQSGTAGSKALVDGDAKASSPAIPEAGKLPTAGDPEATAREAISHLAFNGFNIQWEIPGEPSDEVRRLVTSYFQGGEIVRTLEDLACRYVMKALADDHLGITGITIPETDSAARNGRDETRPPERR